MERLLIIPLLILFVRVVYLVLTPNRVRFTRYQEWDFPGGVVIIDETWGHPDYRAPDVVRRYGEETR